MNSFFIEMKAIENLKEKLGEFGAGVINKFKSLGNWTDRHSLMLSNFLEERFLMAGLVRESNRTIDKLKHDLETSEASRLKL